MTKEEAIIRMQKNFSSFHNDFIDGKLEFSDITEEEKEKLELLTNLSYLFPYISLSILLKDILGSAEVLEHFITDREQKENFQEEKKNFMSLISKQEFFKEKFIDVLFYKDKISKLEKENKELNHRNKELESRLEIIEREKDQEVEKAKQRKSEKSDDSCTINGHEYVDLGLPSGLKWATCNVGANSPEEYGEYFAWGETYTKNEYYGDNCDLFGVEMEDIGGNPYYDVATSEWGEEWRLPTKEEFEELVEKCEWKWMKKKGVNGMLVTGPNGKSIFLPAAGFRYGSSLNSVGSGGIYWSSIPDDGNDCDNYAYCLYFYSVNQNMYGYFRSNGLSVRPVVE